MTALEDVLASTAGALEDRLDRVFADLAVLCETAGGILAGPARTRGALEALRPVVERILSEHEGFVSSAGVSMCPGVLVDAESWHQWWSLVDGKAVFVPHNLNPDSVNYYDYAEMTWFERPRASGRPELTGPYIDFGGAFDSKVVTAARPIQHGAQTEAIAGADLSMESIEHTFLKHLGRRDEHIALITETGKVVASNSARFAPGTRFQTGAGRRTPVPIRAGLASAPWHIVAAD